MADESDRDKIARLVESARTALVTTVNENGELVSRPLALQKRDFDGILYFFTADPSPKTDQIRANPQVNVAVQDGDGYLSLTGTGSVSRDQGIIAELWNPAAEAWFENGREDPAVALLKFDASSAEYWTVDVPKPIAVLAYAKAIITHTQPDIASNATVQL